MNNLKQNPWNLRPATRDDLDGVCDVISAYSLDLLGVDADNRKFVVLTWDQPGFVLETDTLVAVLPDGRVIGYGEVEDVEPPHVRAGSWIRVHPEFQGFGLEEQLLDWIERRALRTVDKAPLHARVILTQGVSDEDKTMQALFERRGFQLVRHFWRMVIDLESDIPVPAWPQGVHVRTLVLEEDLEAMVRAFRDSFCDHWGHVEMPFEDELKQWSHWIHNDPEFDESLTFLAIANGEIVALASCDPRDTEDQATGHVAILGVTRAWRRRGIALALLHHVFREFKTRGQARVSLGVDAASLTGAVRLYEAAGMKMSRQFNAFEKQLRSGEDLSLRALSDTEDA